MSADLLSWLRSVIEGDRAVAEANNGEKWTAHDEGKDDNWSIAIGDGQYKMANACGCCCVGTLDEVEAKHIALHDPRDTIARCEAELALLDNFERHLAVWGPIEEMSPDVGQGALAGGLQASMMVSVLKALARGYRHRAGFNPEWVSD